MESRSPSWMDEVGTTRPRRPSANGPLLPYQLPTNRTKPNGNRAHSFSGEYIANHRGFTPLSGFSAAMPILEDAIHEGSDGGSDITQSFHNRRMSTPLMSLHHASTPYAAFQRSPWTNDTRSPLTPQGGFFDFETNVASAPSFFPTSPTGVTQMRRLTAELANVVEPNTRDPVTVLDPKEWSSYATFSQLPPFQKTHFVPAKIKTISEESCTWDATCGGLRPRGDWEHPSAHDIDTLRYAVVAFKNNRADVFYFHTVQGMVINEGSIVVVDADRGQDLGTVLVVLDSPLTAHDVKKRLNKEHYDSLLQLSQTARPPGWSTESSFNTYHDFNSSCSAFAGGFPMSDLTSSVRKRIRRRAYERELSLLEQRRELEERAKRLCILAVQRHGLHLHEMEILDAEFQHDFNKLTFYFLSPQYLHFNPLVTELFKLFKTRIWMSALNPASCVAPSPMAQMPRGPRHWYDAGSTAMMTPRLSGHNGHFSSVHNLDLQV